MLASAFHVRNLFEQKNYTRFLHSFEYQMVKGLWKFVENLLTNQNQNENSLSRKTTLTHLI